MLAGNYDAEEDSLDEEDEEDDDFDPMAEESGSWKNHATRGGYKRRRNPGSFVCIIRVGKARTSTRGGTQRQRNPDSFV